MSREMSVLERERGGGMCVYQRVSHIITHVMFTIPYL